MTGRKISELELLAPARNIDIGIAAIDCGADAVYIAGPQFGARQAAGNSIDDIRKLCSYAHRFGARVFITLNTILYDTELDAALEQMLAAQEAGADAIITQDLAVLELAAKSRFRLPLHASTQCAIRTPEQAEFYESLGFSRLILERELSLKQIESIRRAVSCELEFFVHGALCVCYSGQCYMSEAITGRSANRGACAQACRSLYDLEDGNGKTIVRNKALLSLKDLNLKDRLEDLAQAGITSFKIEGRLKNISYVKNIVRDYSIALDRMVSKAGGDRYRASYGQVSGGFSPDPDKTFNRGYTRLFIDGRRGKWSTYDSAKGMGEEIGTISGLSRGKDIINIRPSGKAASEGSAGMKLNNGDGFSFVSRKSDVIGFRADVCNGTEIRCRPVPELFIGARLFRNTDTAFEKELESETPAREIRVETDIRISRTGEEFTVYVSAESEDGRKCSAELCGGTQQADNTERMKALFIKQLSKSSGHYRFSVKDLENSCGGAMPLISVSSINGVRRDLAAALDEMTCIARPLMNRTAALSGRHAELRHPTVAYKANVSNILAEKVYRESGAESIESAFELTHRPGIEFMRTRYCIRHELGLCSKHTEGSAGKDLYLINNGRKFTLRFDCAACEMTVLQDTPVSRK